MALRRATPPLIVRVADGALMVDLRTVPEDAAPPAPSTESEADASPAART